MKIKKDLKVSVIVPIYNAQKFLKKSIESVLNQTYRNTEVILVNDGSTDNSLSLCNQYASVDKRIKIISQKNKGPAAARNTGIRHASGNFVFFLDADDFIDKNALKILIAASEKYHPDMVMSNFCKLENSGEIINQSVAFRPDSQPFRGKKKTLSPKEMVSFVRHFLKYPSNHLISYCWARLYKSDIIKKNKIFANEKMRLFEDFVFNLEYLKTARNTLFVNQPLYTYRMHTSHLSASMAIINAKSLLHDMNIFRVKASQFLRSASVETADQEIGHCLIHYVIIFLIRSCRLVNKDNKKMILSQIKKVIDAPIFKESLPHYRPSKGNSRILPWLTKLKAFDLIILYCQYKAYKRYGRPEKI